MTKRLIEFDSQLLARAEAATGITDIDVLVEKALRHVVDKEVEAAPPTDQPADH